MKKAITLSLVAITMAQLSGCATSDMFGNSQTQYTQPQGYGAICEICNRYFVIPANSIQNGEQQTKCPYCEHIQNIEPAINRYSYALQQQNNAANQQFWQNMQQINQEHAQRSQEIFRNRMNKSNEPSRLGNSTNCSPDGIGGLNCNTYTGIGNRATMTHCSPNGIGGFNCNSY